MSFIDDIRKKAADLVSEEVPDTHAPSPSAAPVPSTQGSTYTSIPVATPRPDLTIPGTDMAPGAATIYSKLCDKTCEAFMPALQKLQQLEEPLRGIIPDRATRLRAAFAQAKAQGLTVDQVNADLNKLYAALKEERTHFDNAIEAKRNELVTGKLSEAQQLENKIVELQSQIAVLAEQQKAARAAVEVAQIQLTQRVTDFTAAERKRRQNLDELTAEYNAILK